MLCIVLSWKPTPGNLTTLTLLSARPPVTGFFKRNNGFIPPCHALLLLCRRNVCRTLMTIVAFLFCATRCACSCTCPMSHCIYPQSLPLCICTFTNGRSMMCTPGWMPAIPPPAMQPVQVGRAASSHLHWDPPPFSQVMSAPCPVLLDLLPPAEPIAYVHDASWYPGHCHSGGALAVLNLVTGVYKLYPVHIPIFRNNSY